MVESHFCGLVPEELRRLPEISDETAKAAANCNVLTPRQQAEIKAVINAVRAAKIRKLQARDGHLMGTCRGLCLLGKSAGSQ